MLMVIKISLFGLVTAAPEVTQVRCTSTCAPALPARRPSHPPQPLLPARSQEPAGPSLAGPLLGAGWAVSRSPPPPPPPPPAPPPPGAPGGPPPPP